MLLCMVHMFVQVRVAVCWKAHAKSMNVQLPCILDTRDILSFKLIHVLCLLACTVVERRSSSCSPLDMLSSHTQRTGGSPPITSDASACAPCLVSCIWRGITRWSRSITATQTHNSKQTRTQSTDQHKKLEHIGLVTAADVC